MKYIGNYQNNNLPKAEYPKLFAYYEDIEIIISYNEQCPFFVEQVAILFDSEYNTYAIFNCGYMCETDDDAKEFGVQFTKELFTVLRNYGS